MSFDTQFVTSAIFRCVTDIENMLIADFMKCQPQKAPMHHHVMGPGCVEKVLFCSLDVTQAAGQKCNGITELEYHALVIEETLHNLVLGTAHAATNLGK